MEIVALDGIAGAAEARGHVVVIDVLRAFTCAAYAFEGGAREILLAGTVADALDLHRARPGAILIGQGRRDESHHFPTGNSPWALRRTDLRDRTLVQRTGNGTRGVVAATNAEAVYLASLVNATATARHLRAIGAGTVSLVASGWPPDGVDGPEDVACRDLIAARLRREEPDVDAIRTTVRGCPAAAELLDPSRGDGCYEDLHMALDVDRFDFAMPVRRDGSVLVARRADVKVPPSAATTLPHPLARIATWRRLRRIASRDEVDAAVDALIAADRVTDALCELVGRRGAPSAEDLDLLDRALAAAGVVVDTETAVLVESVAVAHDLAAGRITPADARAAMPRPPDFGWSHGTLDLGPWYDVWCADEIGGHRSMDAEVVASAREILRTHGPAFGIS